MPQFPPATLCLQRKLPMNTSGMRKAPHWMHSIVKNFQPATKQEMQMNKELFEKGLKMRRAVLGDAHVDASLKSADAFSVGIQELVTEYCWGEVWNRPGLDRRTRSFLNLAMLTALNRPHEIKLHVKGAINNGLSKDEIAEV